jgi:hypothetical protein
MNFSKLLKPAGDSQTGSERTYAQYVALFFEVVGILGLSFSALWLVTKLIVFLYFNAMPVWGILALCWLFMFGLLIGFHRRFAGKLSLLNAIALWVTVIVINLGFAVLSFQKIPEQALSDPEDFQALFWLVCHCVMLLLALSALLDDLGVFEDYSEPDFDR